MLFDSIELKKKKTLTDRVKINDRLSQVEWLQNLIRYLYIFHRINTPTYIIDRYCF